MQSNCACCGMSPEGMGTLLMRLALGMLFFVAGLGKFLAPDGFTAVAAKIESGFANTWLPAFLVAPYAHMLPFVEVTLGAVLLLGVCTRWAFFAAGVLLVSLAFGMLVQQQAAVVGTNLTYVLMAAAGAVLAGKDNPLSIDGAVCRYRGQTANQK